MHCRKNESVGEATDALLQAGLATNTMKVVREYTTIIDEMLKMAADADPKAKNVASDVTRIGVTTDDSVEKQNDYNQKILQMRIDFCLQQRQTAVECLFFIAYNVQMSEAEAAEVWNLIKDLVNGTAGSTLNGIYLHQFNPLTDAPRPPPESAQAWIGGSGTSPRPQRLQEKDPLEWQNELVMDISKTGYRAQLECISRLIAACYAAVDNHNVLLDRFTHKPNTFREVTKYMFEHSELPKASGNRPILRAELERGAKDGLQVCRTYQEQQQHFNGQFQTWSGKSTSDSLEDVPDSVDLLTCPYSMDSTTTNAPSSSGFGVGGSTASGGPQSSTTKNSGDSIVEVPPACMATEEGNMAGQELACAMPNSNASVACTSGGNEAQRTTPSTTTKPPPPNITPPQRTPASQQQSL
jgi:hypothetical protein